MNIETNCQNKSSRDVTRTVSLAACGRWPSGNCSLKEEDIVGYIEAEDSCKNGRGDSCGLQAKVYSYEVINGTYMYLST